MQNVIVGILALVVGGALALRGYVALRLLIAVWGALFGFFLGAGLVAGFTDAGFLAATLGWVAGIVLALVFGAIAYLYYAVSIVIGMAGIGFALGTGFMAALHVEWSWFTVLVGIVVGVLLAALTIVADLPSVFLVVLSALGGAVVVVFGLMALFGIVDTADFTTGEVTARLSMSWWWYAVYLAVALAGVVAQARHLSGFRGTVRDQWSNSNASSAPGRV
ncbi:putative Oligopeptide transporters, OPT superfamily [Nostocoides japonicum T1-X7]|uniref:Putative Oligopeptide transporters, OPT superfamily n=1 Tax=Nostocoides japonicum T1-X7 TaxID=1194083 RepID=A0A077LUV6_9MICO|nr:DUF4203 domain-containing protein [Tetrasphaera japonica]CCH77678.1 putative Oligopeptide transporters, OPT superfamily [Tetrasphaera japonica T1-X7]